MSEQIDEIFTKFTDIFLGRQDDIKDYLRKYYKKIFKMQDVINVERIDATDKIQTSGFRKNLSSWRNTYNNIVVSTSLELGGEKKRFDYKFIFTEERLAPNIVEAIEEGIKLSQRHKKMLQFSESLEKIDSSIELIKNENDRYYNKKLIGIRSEVLKAKKEYEKKSEEIADLEQQVRVLQDSERYDEAIEKSNEIIKIATSIRKTDVIKKNKKQIEEFQKLIEDKKVLEEKQALEAQLQKLEVSLKDKQENKDYIGALSDCEKIIEISRVLVQPDMEEKYTVLFSEFKANIEEMTSIQEEIKKFEDSIKQYQEKGKYNEALEDCERIIQLSKVSQQEDIQEKYQELIQTIKEQIKNQLELEETQGIEAKIQALEGNIKTDQEEDGSIVDILSKCEEIVMLAKSINNDEIENKYRALSEEFKLKIEEIKALEGEIEKLEVLIKEEQEAENFTEALSNCEKGIEISAKLNNLELREKFSQIKEEINNKIGVKSALREKEEIEEQIFQLEESIKKSQEEDKHDEILSGCEKIIELSKIINNKEIEVKYSDISEEVSKEIGGREALKEEFKQLEAQVILNQEEENLEEAIKNCERIIEILKIIKNDELEAEYTQLSQEIYKNIEEKKDLNTELKNLEEKIKLNQEKEEFEEAIKNCERIIEISKVLNLLEIKEKYNQLLEQIKEKAKDSGVLEEDKAQKERRAQEIKDAYKEKKAQKEKEQELLRERAKEIEGMIESEENVLPLVEDFSIDDLIGDLSDVAAEALEQIGNLLMEYRVEVKSEVKNVALLTSASGEVIEQENIIQIKASENMDEDATYKLSSGLTNPFDDIIEEAIITDLIPYNFEITNIELNGKIVEELPDNTLTKDGLEVQWQFENVAKEDKVEINYDLRRRVSRTVIFILRSQIKIIKTHSSLSALDIEGLFEAKLPLTNSYDSVLEGVVVEDIIPLYYLHFIKEPMNILPEETPSSKIGELIRWNIGRLDPATILYHYKLLELFKFEELKIEINKLDKEGFEALKKEDIPNSINKYKEILNQIQIYIK